MKTFQWDDLASRPGFRWHACSSCTLRRTRPLCDRLYDSVRIHESYISVPQVFFFFSSLAENVNMKMFFFCDNNASLSVVGCVSNKHEERGRGTLIVVWVVYIYGPSFLHAMHIISTWNIENDTGIESTYRWTRLHLPERVVSSENTKALVEVRETYCVSAAVIPMNHAPRAFPGDHVGPLSHSFDRFVHFHQIRGQYARDMYLPPHEFWLERSWLMN